LLADYPNVRRSTSNLALEENSVAFWRPA